MPFEAMEGHRRCLRGLGGPMGRSLGVPGSPGGVLGEPVGGLRGPWGGLGGSWGSQGALRGGTWGRQVGETSGNQRKSG